MYHVSSPVVERECVRASVGKTALYMGRVTSGTESRRQITRIWAYCEVCVAKPIAIAQKWSNGDIYPPVGRVTQSTASNDTDLVTRA